MPELSQTENQTGWKPPASPRLRKGQQKLYQSIIEDSSKNKYTIMLPTGYGKSWCACIAFAAMRSQGRIDRMLLVVPTDQQRSQYIDGLREDLSTLGIPYAGIERCDNQATWVIKQSLRNRSDIFIAGIQSIASDPGYYSDLMSKGRWLVVADEFHHYSDSGSWGEAIKSLPYQSILGMSATPLRKDKKPTIFGFDHFDVEVSIADAYEEGAIKRIESRIGDYAVSWSSLESPDPQNSLMSELASEWSGDISEYEIKKGVRYYDKYISEIFLQVLSAWADYEREWPGQNQILVFAMSCRHAEMISRIINDCAFPGFPQPFSDWIGVGEGETSNRSDKENSDILQRFQDNKLPCLVQVNKAGEGFNNKRCSIGLFLDLVGDSPMKQQHIGRFMRVNSNAPGQMSLIFISEDSPCKALLEGLDDEFGITEEEKKSKREGSQQSTRQLFIPDILIIDTKFESERVVYPFGSPEAAMENYLNDAPEAVKAAYESIPPDMALELFKSGVQDYMKEIHKKEHPPLSSTERREQARRQLEQNMGRLVGHLLTLRYGKSFPKTAKGDMYKLIHGQWKRTHGSQAELTDEDINQKNKWIQQVAESINQKGREGIPTWLM